MLCIAGAAVGVLLGFLIEPYIKAKLEPVLGFFEMTWHHAGLAVTIALALGTAVAVLPALRARRLSIAQALRGAD
jgi:ABC-type antimicrobial peptide transport system permease subunit